ncbi:hypothetical protein ACVU7I_13440, partial [Patulibacter sp. S7RM1-6]
AGVVREARALPEPTGPGPLHLRLHGQPRIEARTADPARGPDWAVRVFLADRTFTEDGRTRVIGRNRCVQLGRIHRGRFGWVDGSGVFRPSRISLFHTPTHCGSRRDDLGGHPHVEALTLTSGLQTASPHLAATVLWGMVGAAGRDVRTVLAGRTQRGADGRHGVVLRVAAPGTRPPGSAYAVTYPRDGAATHRVVHRASTPARIAVRAPAPAGGVPYGLPMARDAGGWCVGQPGRIVEGRVGTVDFTEGTFREATESTVRSVGGCGHRSPRLTRKLPVTATSGGEDLGGEPDAVRGQPDPTHVARRTLPGLSWFAGRARDDVASITFRTPRNVRTVVPSGPARAYLVVLDGVFTSGETRMTYRFTDGTETTQRFLTAPY